MPAAALEAAITNKIDPQTSPIIPSRAVRLAGAAAPATIKPGEATSLQLALAAAQVAEDNRGEDIVILDLRDLTPVFDYFVLATGNSRRQLHAISEEIDHCLEDDLGERRMGIEGYAESRWILLDYGSIVIHIFDAETREFYALEDLWIDAKRVEIGE